MASTVVSGSSASYLGQGLVGLSVVVPSSMGAEEEGDSPLQLDEPSNATTANGSPCNDFSCGEGEDDDTGSSRCGESVVRMPSYCAGVSLGSVGGGDREKRSVSVASDHGGSERCKKRRKQSNPVRIAASRFCEHDSEVLDYGEMPMEDGVAVSDVDGATNAPSSVSMGSPRDGHCEDTVFSCPHCDALCDDEDLLRRHIELEHVQRALELQLQQQQGQKNNGMGIGSGLFTVDKDFHRQDLLADMKNSIGDSEPSSSPPKNDLGSKSIPSAFGITQLMQQQQQQLPPPPPPPSHHHPQNHNHHNHTSPLPQLQDPKDVASLMALSAFGSSPFFLPLMSCGAGNCSGNAMLTTTTAPSTVGPNGTPPTSTSSGSSAASNAGGPPIRIFNPEAYCELCNKEFCNKYFLKTHKANKHGIYIMEASPLGSGGSPFGGPAHSPMHLPPTPTPPIPTTSSVPTEITSPQRTPVPSLSTQMQQHSLPPPNMPPAIMNLEAFCDICQKEFCNKYFLRKHRQKIHGIHDAISSSPSTPTSAAAAVWSAAVAAAAAAVGDGVVTSSCMPVVTTSVAPVVTSSIITSYPSEITISSDHAAKDLSLKTSPITNQDVKNHGLVGVNVNGNGNGCPGSSTNYGGMMLVENPNGTFFTPERLREMGVINVEAFCEICCKEFCNKYFLRTHKMNKHGIMIGDGTSPPGPGKNPNCNGKQMEPLSLVVEKEQHIGTSVHGNGVGEEGRKSTTPSSSSSSLSSASNGPDGNLLESVDLTCEVCSRPFASPYLLKMHKYYFHNIGDQMSDREDCRPQDADSPTGNGELPQTAARCRPASGSESTKGEENGERAPINEDLQKLQSMIKELNATPKNAAVKCGVCQKEMKNKYFLRAHMINEHGELHNESDLDGGEYESGFVANRGFSAMAIMSHLQSQMMNPGVTDPESYCELCRKEFCSRYFLRLHKMSVHGFVDKAVEPSAVVGPAQSQQPPPPLQQQQQQQQPTHTQLPQASQNHQNFEKSKFQEGILSIGVTGSMANNTGERISGVTGRNFCEICNKELCNKYFMKTHMLKMHGISVDDSVAGGGSVPGATIGGVTCDICQKELCSKYFLKVHKQNTHGVVEDPPPGKEPCGDGKDEDGGGSGRYFSHYTEVCPLCERRFKSIKWLKTHMVNDHADVVKDPATAAAVAVAAAAAATASSANLDSYSGNFCVICHKAFGDTVALHVHLIKDHPGMTDVGPGYTSGNLLSPLPPLNHHHHHNHNRSQSHHQHHHHHHHHQQQQQQQQQQMQSTANHLHHQQSCSTSCNSNGSSGSASDTSPKRPRERPSQPLQSSAPPPPPPLVHNSTSTTPVAVGNGAAPVQPPPAESLTAAGLGYSLDPPKRTCSSGLMPFMQQPFRRVTGSHGSRVYHCSYCSYTTRWLSNLYAHEKRHTGLSTEGEKRFGCRVCHRTYRYNHSLQRHLLSHRGTCGVAMRASPNNNHYHSSVNNSLTTPTSALKANSSATPRSSKVKKYWCSKCGAKYRSREQCLDHIHNIHNARIRSSATTTILHPKLSERHDDDEDEEKDDGDDDPTNQGTNINISDDHSTLASGKSPIPMTYGMPQNPPPAGSFIMQPFLMTQPDTVNLGVSVGTNCSDNGSTGNNARDSTFVPSLVYLPVSHKVVEPVTISFHLTPA